MKTTKKKRISAPHSQTIVSITTYHTYHGAAEKTLFVFVPAGTRKDKKPLNPPSWKQRWDIFSLVKPDRTERKRERDDRLVTNGDRQMCRALKESWWVHFMLCLNMYQVAIMAHHRFVTPRALKVSFSTSFQLIKK